jgi:hypothetical protein
MVYAKMQGMPSRLLCCFLALVLVLGIAGCATLKQSEINTYDGKGRLNRKTAEGISVAADPYHARQKAKSGFAVDVTSKGFLPVELTFENETDEPVRVLKQTIQLSDGDGSVFRPVGSGTMWNRFKKNPVARLVAFSSVSIALGVASYVHAVLSNRKLKVDWRRKEIPDQLIIPPGRTVNGFVYFKLPDDRATTVSKLCLESERLTSGRKVPFELVPEKNESPITISPIERNRHTKPVVIQPNI